MEKHPATANFQAGMRVYKLVLLGEGGVGKSALTLQFVSHSFLDYHDPTIEDAYQQQTVIDTEVGLLDILDTAGQMLVLCLYSDEGPTSQEFTAMREQYMRTGEGFIIIYSITDRRTFEEASRYKQQIQRVRPTEGIIPMVVVGNKYDLEDKREVSKEEGKSLAKDFDCPFFETSAALRHFVDDVFHQIVREIRNKERDEVGGYKERKSKRKVVKFFRNVFKKKKKA